MGSLLTGLLARAGYRVVVLDLRDGPVSWDELSRCPVVFLAVPIPALAGVVERIGPLTSPDGVVIDLCSLKEDPVRAMLVHCRGEVIGGHPLFGPDVGSLENQTFFVCPARSRRWLGWLKGFLRDQGARVIEIGPREHDDLMAVVQVLRHLLLTSFGLSLARLGFDPRTDPGVAGPWFTTLLDMLGRQLRQPPGLYADLAVHNPATGRICREFGRAAADSLQAFGSGDRRAISQVLEQVSAYLDGGGS